MGKHCKHKCRHYRSCHDEEEEESDCHKCNCNKCSCDKCKNVVVVECKGEKGDDGLPGKDGIDGLPGKDGIDGSVGPCPTITACNDPCNILEITQTDCNVCIKIKCPSNGDCHCKSQGYWKNHPEEWTDRNDNLICSCKWLDILLMDCGDDQIVQWRNLARQYITMELNKDNGCDTSSLSNEMLEAKTILELCLGNSYTTVQRSKMSYLTDLFDAFIVEKEVNCNNNQICDCFRGPAGKDGKDANPCECQCNPKCITKEPIEVSVSYPGSSNTYFNINYTQSLFQCCDDNIPRPLEGWCSDFSNTISQNTNYTGIVVSSLDINLSSIFSQYGVQILEKNIQMANYIINKKEIYVNAPFNYTFGDIQTAIWRVLEDPNASNGSAPFTQANVDAILLDANTNGKNYIPVKSTDCIIIFIIPTGLYPNNTGTKTNQMILGCLPISYLNNLCWITNWGKIISSNENCCCVCNPHTLDFSIPNSSGGVLETSYTWTMDTTPNLNVIAYGYLNNGTPTNLYNKRDGVGEEGLGIASDVNYEINNSTFIQLDLNEIITKTDICNPPTITIGSIQGGEGYQISGSNTQGVQGNVLYSYTNSGSDPIINTIPIPSFNTSKPYRYISITATAVNVILTNIIVYTCDTASSGSGGTESITANSIFIWSEQNQDSVLNEGTSPNYIAKYAPVVFEHGPIGPIGSVWTFIDPQTPLSFGSSIGQVSGPTKLVCGKSGYYSITYKIDVKADNGNPDISGSNTNAMTLLTKNGNQIPGSMTFVQAPESNHIYTIANTVIVFINKDDVIQLLFWSDDATATHIGSIGDMPSWLILNGSPVKEATASMVITGLT